jgi:hypothetical protein
MKPYIIDVDRTTMVGEMVANYGEYEWTKGFLMGHLSGLCVGGAIVWILLAKRGFMSS